jgi:hypothetical protein
MLTDLWDLILISRSTLLVPPQELVPTHLDFMKCSGSSSKIYEEILFYDAIKFSFRNHLFLLSLPDIGFLGDTMPKIRKTKIRE